MGFLSLGPYPYTRTPIRSSCGLVLVSPAHGDFADPTDQAQVGRGLDLLAADRADVAVGLFTLGLGLLLRRNASEGDLQHKTILLEGLLEGVGRAGVRESHGAVVPDLQVAGLSLGLEGLIVVKCKSTGAGRPLGYCVDKEKHFQIDPEGAQTVRTIFELYISGEDGKLKASDLASLEAGVFDQGCVGSTKVRSVERGFFRNLFVLSQKI